MGRAGISSADIGAVEAVAGVVVVEVVEDVIRTGIKSY
jgi:hypothetical protein